MNNELLHQTPAIKEVIAQIKELPPDKDFDYPSPSGVGYRFLSCANLQELVVAYENLQDHFGILPE